LSWVLYSLDFEILKSKKSPDFCGHRTRGVSHCGPAIYIRKYLKAKRRIMKIQIFHHAKTKSSKKSSEKKPKSFKIS
jgi:hypothetical protein